MRAVGLTDPRSGQRPYAVVQLRQENQEKTLYNLVGFQTKMTYPEQRRVFAMIPGLENAEFVRLGSLHRNTFINSPEHLLPTLQWRQRQNLFFAGQMTGVEGYIESAATGLLAGINAARLVAEKPTVVPPATTALGALLRYITDPGAQAFSTHEREFRPAAAACGTASARKSKKEMMARRALADMAAWASQNEAPAAFSPPVFIPQPAPGSQCDELPALCVHRYRYQHDSLFDRRAQGRRQISMSWTISLKSPGSDKGFISPAASARREKREVCKLCGAMWSAAETSVSRKSVAVGTSALRDAQNSAAVRGRLEATARFRGSRAIGRGGGGLRVSGGSARSLARGSGIAGRRCRRRQYGIYSRQPGRRDSCHQYRSGIGPADRAISPFRSGAGSKSARPWPEPSRESWQRLPNSWLTAGFPLTLVGIAGTFTTLSAVEKKLLRYAHGEVHGSRLTLGEVQAPNGTLPKPNHRGAQIDSRLGARARGRHSRGRLFDRKNHEPVSCGASHRQRSRRALWPAP